MPDRVRKKRQPISCTPCRGRKIRCPRDGKPCSTCVRRTVTCSYATQPTSHTDDEQRASQQSLQPASPLKSDSSRADLSQRVRRLEQLLLATSPDSPSFSANGSVSPNPAQPAPTSSHSHGHIDSDFDGTLQVDNRGYVKFVAGPLQWQPSRLAMADVSAFIGVDRFPVDRTDPAFTATLIAALPSQADCAELVHVYFTSYASLFHILHDPTFYQQYERFEKCAYELPLAWLALLFAILGTAVHALPSDSRLLNLSHKPRPLEKVEELASRYRTLAMKCLENDHYLWRQSLTTVQTMVILIYGIGHSHGQTWSLLGLTHHLALSIGCHVDPSRFDLDPVQCEERRRCWAALKMLYTHQNTILGHQGIGHTHFPADCCPPADLDDADLVSGSTMIRGESFTDAAKPTHMTYLLLKFHMYDICSDICESVLSKKSANYNDLNRLDKVIQDEQRSWSSRFVGSKRADNRLPCHHLAHVYILRSYAGHLTLLLHQQVVLETGRTNHGDAFRRSRLRCLDAARNILDIHANMQENPTMKPFQWYNRGVGSFHAFHAAVVLIRLCQQAIDHNYKQSIGGSIQRCLVHFATISRMSPFCVKAGQLLESFAHQNRMLEPDNGDDNVAEPIRNRVAQNHGQYSVGNSSGTGSLDAASPFTGNGIADTVDTAISDQTCNETVEGHDRVIDWDALLSDTRPQQWLSPVVFPLDQWITMTGNAN